MRKILISSLCVYGCVSGAFSQEAPPSSSFIPPSVKTINQPPLPDSANRVSLPKPLPPTIADNKPKIDPNHMITIEYGKIETMLEAARLAGAAQTIHDEIVKQATSPISESTNK